MIFRMAVSLILDPKWSHAGSENGAQCFSKTHVLVFSPPFRVRVVALLPIWHHLVFDLAPLGATVAATRSIWILLGTRIDKNFTSQ